jgi:hypothetical protein
MVGRRSRYRSERLMTSVFTAGMAAGDEDDRAEASSGLDILSEK